MSARVTTGAGLALGLSAAVAAYAGCGGRSPLYAGPPKPPTPECVVDADCLKKEKGADLCHPFACVRVQTDGGAGGGGGGPAMLVAQCVAEPVVDCDDNDPCTTDTCDGATGECHYAPSTLDLDGDGHRAPLPGFAPGAPGSCGDDCDDTNPNAYPGHPEVCDGVDNDCNGIVDDNATYTPLDGSTVLVSGDVPPAGPGGLAYGGVSYAGTYTGTDNGFNVYLSNLAADGTVITPPGEEDVTLINADASGGPIVWVGDRYGLTWQDRRTDSYEIYFTILDAAGTKKHADTELTFSQGFSVNPALAWNGNEFLVAWQDDRTGAFNVFGQRVSVDSAPVGDNIQLTMASGGLDNEAPSVAAGLKTVGVAWVLGDAMTHIIQFQPFSLDLTTPASPPVELTNGTTAAIAPDVVWNHDRYVVAWYDKSASPAAVYAATVGEDGTVLAPTTPITHPGAFRSRYPYMRPLGDRLLVVFSDDRDQNGGYEIYTRMIKPDLTPLGDEVRVTDAPRDSVFPFASFGPKGDVGILFRDDRDDGLQNIYFTRLGCVEPGMPPP